MRPIYLGTGLISIGVVFLLAWSLLFRRDLHIDSTLPPPLPIQNVPVKEKPIHVVVKEKPTQHVPVKEKSVMCPNMLENMLKGKWWPRKKTKDEAREISILLENARTGLGLPKGLQREDLLCGNATFAAKPYDKYRWFRALCNPDGDRPCCMNNKCEARSVGACKCKNCLDLRQTPDAEYSEWKTDNKQCQVHKFVGEETCELLDGMTIFISGDSFMRHFFMAMLLVIENNNKTAFLKKGIPKAAAESCQGTMGFTERGCRKYIRDGMAILCDGRVNVTYAEYYSTAYARKLEEGVKDLSRKEKSLVVAGIGYHDQFNFQSVSNRYIRPVVDITKTNAWPRFVWFTPPAPGLLTHPTLFPQTLPKLLKYTKDTTEYVKKRNIPIFNAFELTRNMMSFDGIHYGPGINVQKAHIMLNYIQELRRKEKW